MDKGRDADFSHLNAMRNEKEALVWLDTTSNKTLEQAMKEAKAVQASDKLNRENTVNKPSQLYLSDMKNGNYIKRDLTSDGAMIEELERSIADSKKHVHGTPSPQFIKMEEAFNAFKQLNLELRNANDLGDQEMEAYRQSLSTLTKAAKAYEDYKLVNGTKQMNALKSKEVRRVQTSRLLQDFARERVKLIDRSFEQDAFRAYVESKIQANEIEFKEKLNHVQKENDSRYFLEKLDLEKKAARFPSSAHSKEDYASNVFKNLDMSIKAKSGNAASIRVDSLKVLIKGAFGGISRDHYFTDMGEKLLENGSLPKKDCSDFWNSAVGAVKNSKKNKPGQYKRAALNALQLFAKKASSMDSIQPNFVFLTDLAKFTYEAEVPENRAKLNESVANTVKGMEEAGKIVKAGMASWKKMLEVEPGERAEYDAQDMLNFVAMRVLEASMKQFSMQDSHNKINPMFYFLGSKENGADVLKAAIVESTNGMKQFNELNWVAKEDLLTKKNEAIENGFTKLMMKSFTTAFDITDEKKAKYEAEFKGEGLGQAKKEENAANILL